jgi:hypothetical protein
MGFQLLTGEVPFLADSMVGVIQHHYMTPVPDMLQVRPEIPKELLDVIYCSLNKDPNDRFATTRDMAVALENVPMSDEDKEESDKLLKELSLGRIIPKVRTGTLPPLALTISGPGPRVQPRPVTSPKSRPAAPAVRPIRRKKKKNKMLMPAMGLIFMGLAGGGFLQYQNMQDAANARATQAKKDSVVNFQKAQAKLGRIVIGGLPPGGQVELKGRLYSNGQIFTDDPGNLQATATADGYEPLAKVVSLTAGKLDTVYFSMTTRQAAVAAQSQQARANLPIIPRDSEQVRFAVRPPFAYVFVDNQQVGTGMFARKIPVGPHTVKYSAPNCDSEDRSITVTKGEPLIVPLLTLNCR